MQNTVTLQRQLTQQELYSCRGCDLWKTRILPVPGEGASPAKVMLIGEGPGDEENTLGRPFVGRSGKVLRENLARVGILPEMIFITNIVKCHTPDNRDPYAEESRACKVWLDKEIEAVQPEVILLCGKIALKQFFDNEPLARCHGSILHKDDRAFVPLYHPAAGLHNQRYYKYFATDLAQIAAKLGDLGIIDHETYLHLLHLRDLPDVIAELQQYTEFALDFETTSLDPYLANMVGISFAWNSTDGVYIPVGAEDQNDLFAQLKPILLNGEIRKIAHNAKYEMSILRAFGIEPANIACTQLLAYILGDVSGTLQLKDLARRHIGREMIRREELLKKGKQKRNMADVPIQDIYPYGADDSLETFRLYQILYPRLDDELLFVYEAIELPLIASIVDMEMNGFGIDLEYLDELGIPWTKELEEVASEIYKLIGKEFNINSPDQLAPILFEDLRLPILARSTKTGQPSTGKAVLQELMDAHPVIPAISRYRELAKLKGTYYDGLKRDVHAITKRVHVSFNQTVAETGRLSSSTREE